ncbi:MAG: YkgJ family cysteine cluster protein [Crenarchaeota archaeon]|nr:MAG: YkgJ family cysteine cluster protein [Thermoproteota archaeon]RDJ34068.1 MAG: YkgJ family cysteine cluster protein [Thermoproteota archaeon]RDJ36817.1 MAG: YkgJ family cysteine cluster protein [Thermoproteota archaeon]RDJ37649.1 MAG: YkgJ family cysteine cluster protein [Thermoproteota archaeon]
MKSSNDFSCISECSQCCIEREYYPSKKFGKIGVLILPKEKNKIESLVKELGIKITVLPRIGISDSKSKEPTEILAFQLMGKDTNGNTCPFLDTESDLRSPHGGFTCKIYENRPLACRAYPLIESTPLTIDSKCKFCQECGQPDGNLQSELESLIQIKSSMHTESEKIWRYATGIGEADDSDYIANGWFAEAVD